MWILSLLHVKPKSRRRSRAGGNPEGTHEELSNSLDHRQLVVQIADLLKEFDSDWPVHKNWKPGIGPFDEDPLVKEIAIRLTKIGITAETQAEVDGVKKIDMVIGGHWAIEFKLARPFRNNGDVEPHWSPKLTYPYEGSYEGNNKDRRSSISDAIKLQKISKVARKCVFVIGFERVSPPGIPLDPVLEAFELLAQSMFDIPLGKRVEETRDGLVHPLHQTLRCVSWEILAGSFAERER